MSYNILYDIFFMKKVEQERLNNIIKIHYNISLKQNIINILQPQINIGKKLV